jgi:hypothetical protein
VKALIAIALVLAGCTGPTSGPATEPADRVGSPAVPTQYPSPTPVPTNPAATVLGPKDRVAPTPPAGSGSDIDAPTIPAELLASITGPWHALPHEAEGSVTAAVEDVCDPAYTNVVPIERRGTVVIDTRGGGLLLGAQRGPAHVLTCLVEVAPDGSVALLSGGAMAEPSFAIGDREIRILSHAYYEVANDRRDFSEVVLLAGSSVVTVEARLPDGQTVTFSSGGGWHAAWFPGRFGRTARGYGPGGELVAELRP